LMTAPTNAEAERRRAARAPQRDDERKPVGR
jgi:hypothetical protein